MHYATIRRIARGKATDIHLTMPKSRKDQKLAKMALDLLIEVFPVQVITGTHPNPGNQTPVERMQLRQTRRGRRAMP